MSAAGNVAMGLARPQPRVALPPVVVEIAADLYAVAGAIPADTSISWIADGLSGWMPIQCYVFRGARDALILDGGLGIHREAIGRGLDHLLAGCDEVRLLVSRWEPDAMVNLPWLVRRYGIGSVLSLGGINPLDFFDGFDAAALQSHAETQAAPATLVPITPGDSLTAGPFEIEVINPSLRLLLTTWFYDKRSHSLFTADSFGFLTNPDAPCPLVARPGASDITVDVLENALAKKFDWLCGAYCDTLVADLERLMSTYRIDRICPTFGAVIEGSDQVAAVMAATIAALERLARRPRQRALAGFDWEAALSPNAVVQDERMARAVIPVTTST